MLKVAQLSKSFATADGGQCALNQVEFEIHDGEFFALLGPSGCGKTTTLRCVAGLEQPDNGTISIREQVVADASEGVHIPAHEREIGMVFQSYAIWPHLNVFENVAYPLRVCRPRLNAVEIDTRVREVLTLVSMEEFAERASTVLSGGQQQRVALARALIRQPSLLLLDEPLSNLDTRLRQQMQHELSDLVERVAITTLYVTHDQTEALALADRIAVMRDGAIVQIGTPEELYERPQTSFVASFLGRANFLSGRMTEIEGEDSSVIMLDADGGRLRLPLVEDSVPGVRYDVVIKPEDLTCSRTPPGPDENVLVGIIERVNFQGSYCECHVRVAGTTIRAQVPSASSVGVSERVWLTINPERCTLFASR
tara:strand:+ start:3580 stop:4683 length:1104 start_codon:yes stop_codon:yes gene_type:complete